MNIQQYRINIGFHYFTIVSKYRNLRSQLKVVKNVKKHNQNLRVSAIYILLILSCMQLISQADILFYNKCSDNGEFSRKIQPNVQICIFFIYQSEIVYGGRLKWSINGLSNNKLQKLINGNRRTLGYKLAVWNCERGLLGVNGATSKLQDIKNFILKNRPHLFGVIESDIFGPQSNHRRIKFDTEAVKSLLSIPGYSVELPATWDIYGQARIVVFVSNEIKCVRKMSTQIVADLPSITFEIGLGRARKTIVNFYYREWTNGISGDNSLGGQYERLGRQIAEWKNLLSEGKDFVCLGDANLCAHSWNNPDYRMKNLSNQVKTFCLECSCQQLVNGFTRVQGYGDHIQQSCIDHITTNVPDKCSAPIISAGGSSDHMAVMITKFSRDLKYQPKTIKKRNYKNFIPAVFLEDVLINLQSGAFQPILDTYNPDVAAALFSDIFGQILNKHAPLKIYQIRNNYVPWISEETKIKMRLRDKFKMEASQHHDIEKLSAYRRLRNEIKSDLQKDEKEYYKVKFYSLETSVGSIWRNVNDLLGTSKGSYSSSPTMICYKHETYTTSKDIANILNKIFIDKVKKLRIETASFVIGKAKERLRAWLDSRNSVPSTFNFKCIDLRTLRKILSKLKGNRSCGVDFVDGYSIKLAALHYRRHTPPFS